MAKRPIFIPRFDGARLVEELLVEFQWHPGFAPVQKKKNIRELHGAARKRGFTHILEVSTKSDEKIGVHLSAFNLRVKLPNGDIAPLESAYQGSKVFERGGPYTDLYTASPREAKRDERLKESGALVRFQFGNLEWGLEPKTAFYDWLYIYSLKDHAEFLKDLAEYDGFTDIEFNPKKSLNCQARACATVVSLRRRNLCLADIDKDLFIRILRRDSAQPHSQDLEQGNLF